jgi:cold shock protein
MLGTCLWYSEFKSCGFITPDNQAENVFVHYSALPSENGRRVLTKGQRVAFDIGEFRGKPVAVNVKIHADESTTSPSNTEVGNVAK